MKAGQLNCRGFQFRVALCICVIFVIPALDVTDLTDQPQESEVDGAWPRGNLQCIDK